MDTKEYLRTEAKDSIDWIISRHVETNHFYDEYIPYEFHLRLVRKVGNDFDHIIEQVVQLHHGLRKVHVVLGLWGHDLIEDTRTNYNDVKEKLGYEAANIIYAVTNEKGKNRLERANDAYYEMIRRTPGAVFVKLCDRIANVEYSRMSGSGMFEKYKQEHFGFIEKLFQDQSEEFVKIHEPMVERLFNLISKAK